MTRAPEIDQAAAALHVGVSLLLRRMRQTRPSGELTLPETAALARLERGGPNTPTALARLEQISPQSMGATLAGLEVRGLIARDQDPRDGRRIVISLTDKGRQLLRDRRSARTGQIAQALAAEFTPDEIAQLLTAAPLLERLAQAL
jgi:DNA-binding MarR family transcriptional regulator